MIEAVHFTPSEQTDRTKLFDFVVEQAQKDVKKIKSRYTSVKPLSEYACKYALAAVKLQEFDHKAQSLFLPNVRHNVVSLPSSEVENPTNRYAFLPLGPHDYAHYYVDPSFISQSAQQELNSQEYFDTHGNGEAYENEVADIIEPLMDRSDLAWSLSSRLGAFTTQMSVNYAKVNLYDKDAPEHTLAVWRGRPIMSMNVHPIIASPMLAHCLAHSDQANDNPITDLAAKDILRKQGVKASQNEAQAHGIQRGFETALREVSPKKLDKLQLISARFIACQPDTQPYRLW